MLNHSRRRIVVALSVSAMILGVAFIPTLLAQRVTQTQRDAPLRTLTLDGKVGNRRTPSPPAGPPPRPLTQAQKLILFKGRIPVAIHSFRLSPDKPTIPNKGALEFKQPIKVHPHTLPHPYSGDTVSCAEFSGDNTDSNLLILFKATGGQLYALDIDAFSWTQPGTFTIRNDASMATQTVTVVSTNDRITAYVRADQDGWLRYTLFCSRNWRFNSVEVTAL